MKIRRKKEKKEKTLCFVCNEQHPDLSPAFNLVDKTKTTDTKKLKLVFVSGWELSDNENY